VPPVVSYAQIKEDIFLLRCFKDIEKGFYIDVGANHPLHHSVTKLFYERGWNGINIEPVDEYYNELIVDRKRDINLKIAASYSEGSIEFFKIPGTGLSTSVEKFQQQHAGVGFLTERVEVKARRIDDICAEFAVEVIHFLKIDVEGAEKFVLDGCDFKKYRPWVVMVESVAPLSDIATYQDWEPILIFSKYTYAGSDDLNRYYVSNEQFSRLGFNFVIPVDDYELATSIWTHGSALKKIEHIEMVNQELNTEVLKLTNEAHSLNVELARIKNHFGYKVLKKILGLT